MSVRLIQVPYDSGFRDYRMGLGPGHLMERGAAERLAAAGPVHAEVIESP